MAPKKTSAKTTKASKVTKATKPAKESKATLKPSKNTAEDEVTTGKNQLGDEQAKDDQAKQDAYPAEPPPIPTDPGESRAPAPTAEDHLPAGAGEIQINAGEPSQAPEFKDRGKAAQAPADDPVSAGESDREDEFLGYDAVLEGVTDDEEEPPPVPAYEGKGKQKAEPYPKDVIPAGEEGHEQSEYVALKDVEPYGDPGEEPADDDPTEQEQSVETSRQVTVNDRGSPQVVIDKKTGKPIPKPQPKSTKKRKSDADDPSEQPSKTPRRRSSRNVK